MICAYCGKDGKGTKEHIISNGVLKLFPECSLTIDSDRNRIHQGDPMIKDVCANCNNIKLPYIDSYAKNLIEKYFMVKYTEDETLVFDYNYTMIQKMCLKFAFNDLRSRKKDISFFDDKIKHFLLHEEEQQPIKNMTILAGLAVNTSSIFDKMLLNRKIRWGDSPILLSNSIVENYDYATGQLILREQLDREELKDCVLSFVFRFNSLQLLMLCWNREIDDELLEKNNKILNFKYPYNILNNSGEIVLSRCTSAITYHLERLIDVTWGQAPIDCQSNISSNISEFIQKYDSKYQQK